MDISEPRCFASLKLLGPQQEATSTIGEGPFLMPWLKILKGDTPERAFSVDREVTVLGRDASCEIVLNDHEASKQHARIIHKDGGFYLEDLQSTNGTKLGDRELTEAHRLEEGDLIEIGSTRLVFTVRDATILSVLDASSQTTSQIVADRPKEKLHALLEIVRSLGGTIDLDGVLDKVLHTLFGIFPQAERGFILLRGEGASELILKASKIRQTGSAPPIFSRTIFNHVVGDGQAVLCQDVGSDSRFSQSPSVKESQIRTMM